MAKSGEQFALPPSHRQALEQLSPAGFSVGKVINAGSYGCVCEARMTLQSDPDRPTEVAVKITQLDTKSSKYVKHFLPKELKAIEYLKHEFIITTFAILLKDNALYVFMERALGGDLLDMLEDNPKGIPEAKTKPLVKGVSLALKYIHDRGFAHRDVKCENILLIDKWRTKAKLTDFGAATACYEPKTGRRLLSDTYTGTRLYTAPEIYRQKPYDAMKSDVFSLGVVLFMMLANQMPFSELDIMRCAKNGRSLRPQLKNQNKLSKYLVTLVQHMLSSEPRKRPNMDKVIKDKWFAHK